jgi:5-formaminoimidazole-4-carboxamide-1-(beta)-D-ribofuranosyl 5'-monophosphate synthetase
MTHLGFMGREEILAIIDEYDKESITIATLGSHSALNILRGAKDEGFQTLCICREKERIIYDSFGIADRILHIRDFPDLLNLHLQQKLKENNTILIPHGSFNAYIGSLDRLKIPVFGNRELMLWETDRKKQRKWLRDAGLRLPKVYEKPEDIDGLAIVKYPGARGGMGYFLACSREDFFEKSRQMVKEGLISEEEIKNAHIQEYIVGANIYFSFFYSPVMERVELIAADRRYEHADGLGRIPAGMQLDVDILLSYTVVGNFPVVLRESLLVQALNAAKSVVEISKKIANPGMVGPFCLEAVFDENAEMTVFEISARIVAGTNVGIPTFPYSYILFGENMYMGKRIAREIKLAIKKGVLHKVIG